MPFRSPGGGITLSELKKELQPMHDQLDRIEKQLDQVHAGVHVLLEHHGYNVDGKDELQMAAAKKIAASKMKAAAG